MTGDVFDTVECWALLERQRKGAEFFIAELHEAQARLTALEQENKRLREALEPVRKAIHEARWRTVVGTGEEVKRVLFVRSSIDRIDAALTHEDKT